MSKNMHDIDLDLVEMVLDISKYVIHRITEKDRKLGRFKSAAELQALVGDTITAEGIGGERALHLWQTVLEKATASIDHPRHLAFVPAAPSRAAIMFDLVTSAASIHGAYWMEGAGGIFAENQAMEWLVSLTGLPTGAFGVFTSGGTAANLSAIVTAREYWRSLDPSHQNHKGILIASTAAHSSVKAMARVIDAEMIFLDTEDQMLGAELSQLIDQLAPEQRTRLFGIVATGGTTNAGIIDDLDGIADVCQQHGLWFHVDAAYGGGALAADSVRHLFKGIERADSISIDPHKWLFSPYDCGAVMYKTPELARKAHGQDGAYLEIFNDPAAFGFNPADYQIQLTRRLRGLPLWFSLAMHGTSIYKKAIERGLELAQIAARKINGCPYLTLAREPGLSCVLFRRNGWEPHDYTHWTFKNLDAGYALVTPTHFRNQGVIETVARFCFINPDTTEADIDGILQTMA